MRIFSCKFFLGFPQCRVHPSLVSTLVIFSTLLFGINSANCVDATFGSNGMLIVDFGGSYDTCKAIRLQSDGKIVMGGRSGDYPSRDFALVRCDSNGNIDATEFGNEGKVTTADLGYDDMLNDLVAIQSDSKLVTVGESKDDIVIVRYNTNGVGGHHLRHQWKNSCRYW